MTKPRTESRPRRQKRGQADRFLLRPSVERDIRSDLSKLFLDLREHPSLGVTDRFKVRYLENEIFSKFLDPAKSSGKRERETAAYDKWHAAERRNLKTNVRLLVDCATFRFPGGDVTSDQIIKRASDTIARVLGNDPDLDVLYGTFTSGASTQFPRSASVVAQKFMDESHATSEAAELAGLARSLCGGWKAISDDLRVDPFEIEIVTGSVMFTVPKTSVIDRCAAKEPGLNMFLQKGVGSYIRSRLKSVLKQDLNDQTVNQRLARQGSTSGTLATIDLSSASDTISCQLVCRLLPVGWFVLLDRIRSKVCCVDGTEVELNMFSSMGNAFTFELESLIFWALTNAVCYFAGARGPISVYGDDIICPSSAAPLLAQVFHFFGFTTNSKKSFWRGPFRESCGKHWYAGVDVTPFYVREPISTVPRLLHFLNRLREWATRDGWAMDEVHWLWEKYASMIPCALRGGSDFDSITSLVTDERPRKRLLPKTRQVSTAELQVGCYLHWLRAADGRSYAPGFDPGRRAGSPKGLFALGEYRYKEPIVTSNIVIVETYYRMVPNCSESTGVTPITRFAAEWDALLGQHHDTTID